MRPDLRLAAAVAAGRVTAAACRLAGRGGGTTYPGLVAQRIDRDALTKLVRPPLGTVLVTGTNGKTTTTGMVVRVLEHAGHRVLTNDTGSNIMNGLVAAAVAGARQRAASRPAIAVFEVDELWLEQAVRALAPRLVIVLNFLRDQLDRSGELETTATRVGQALRALPPGARVVVNGDDPIAWAQAESAAGAGAATAPRAGAPTVVPVGIDAADLTLPALPHSADARACPRCEAPLLFDRVLLAHCGSYRCPTGDFQRPAPAVAVTRLAAPAVDALHLALSDGIELDLGLGGVYNAYNAVIAYAACRELGVEGPVIAEGLRRFHPKFGRQERLTLHGRPMRMLLAKNPAGFDEVLRTVDELGGARVYLIAINDGIADGRDVSWLWDVDFERLARTPRRPSVVASGRRARDLAVRLKYAGLPLDRLTVEPDLARALEAVAAAGEATDEPVILPTYTAMLELRALAHRAGAVEPFWRHRPAAAR